MSGELFVGEIDTEQVAEDLPVTDMTVLPGRIYVKREESPTINIYRSGNFSVAGSQSRDEAILAIEWLVDQLHDLGINIEHEEVKQSLEVEFIVLKANVDRNINLELIIDEFKRDTVQYEPEQFPAIIYKPDHISGTATIFSTGEISITGVDSIETGDEIYNSLVDIMGF